jgi:hypothetical protein
MKANQVEILIRPARLRKRRGGHLHVTGRAGIPEKIGAGFLAFSP